MHPFFLSWFEAKTNTLKPEIFIASSSLHYNSVQLHLLIQPLKNKFERQRNLHSLCWNLEMMTTTAAASTGIGGRWMKSFTLHNSQQEFNKDKGNHTSSFRRNTNQRFQKIQCKAFSDPNHPILLVADQLQFEAITDSDPHFVGEIPDAASALMQQLFLIDIDAATAKTLIGVLGPFLSGFGFLFILRIVMSWYPKLPVGKFPYVIAYAPTEPLLAPTRKLIPPLAGVDVTPVVWFGLLSFLNEILVGPQGLLVLLSQQV